MAHSIQQAMDFADKLCGHSRAKHAVGIFAEYMRYYGFDDFIVCSQRANQEMPEPLAFSETWPKEWYKRYIDREYYRHDPIMKYGRSHRQEVFNWRDALEKTGSNSPAHVIFSEQGYFGLKHGYSIPLFLPDGDFAIVQMGGEADNKLSEKDKSILILASRFLIDILRIEAYGSPRYFGEDLSPREREVLLWTASGKTTWEISKILQVAERTVICHQESARRKLGSANPAHSVALAMQRGLIHI